MAFSDVKMHYHQSMFRIRSRRFLVFVAVIPIACLLSPRNAAQVVDSNIQAQVQEHFLAAQQAQQEGRLDTAAREYQTVLRLQPELPEVYVNLGLVYYALAKFEDSARVMAVANRLRPGMHGVSLWLGIDSVRLNRPAQGATFLREAVRQDPNEKLAQSWLGTALWDEGQMDAALIQLRKAAAKFPDDPDLLFARAEAYGKAANEQTQQLLEDTAGTDLSDRIYAEIYVGEHDWAKAEGHLRRAIERNPRSPEARLELAGVFMDQAHMPEAKEQLEQAMTLAPRSAAVQARSGVLLLLMQQQAEGLSRIATAVDINSSEALDALGLPVEGRFNLSEHSDDGAKLSSLSREAVEKLEEDSAAIPTRHIALAALHGLAGDQDASAHEYDLIGIDQLNPSPSVDLIVQATTAFHRHRYDEAETLFLRCLAVHPGDLNVRYDLILARRHIFIMQVLRLLAVAPDSYHVHQLLGQFYSDRDEDDKALEEYRIVAAAEPDLPDVHFWLGHLYWKHGDADHAFTELTRELQLDPGHPEANGELGAVLVAEDRAAEAIPHLESAICSKPDLWPAYSQLGRAYAEQKNYVRAEAVLRRALTHDTDGSTHYQLGLVLRSEGKTAEAAQAFAKVASIKNERMAAPSSDDAAAERIKR
jgi:tetratricopeptide (TPR) repeat protein